MAQPSLAPRLTEAIIAAGVAITGVSIGTVGNKASYLVSPANLQASAQPTIDAFDDSQAAEDAYVATQSERVIGAIRGVRKTADEAFSTTSFADVADLSIVLAPNSHYEFHAYGAYSAAAATTGLQLSVTGPANPVVVRFIGWIAESPTANRNGAGGNYDVAIAGTASAGATALPWELMGTISTGATGGALNVRAKSEVPGGVVTVLRGSVLKVSAVP